MQNRINVAELLKDCPTGMELDCLMYDNLYFDSLNADYYGTINCYTLNDGVKTSIKFTKYGTFNNHTGAKCVIFPKGKTTWEGFVPPCKFKDGDVISDSLGTCIFKGEGVIQGTVDYYCGVHGDYFIVKENTDGHYGDIVDFRLATEEEKQKLFDAIKENGYRWNAETKTLEKVEPIFKVGDRIRHKEETTWTCLIKRIDDKYWVYGHPTCYTIPFGEQDEYELVPNKFDINTLKPFESKVLVRYNKDNKWCGSFFSFIDRDFQSYCYKFVTTAGKSYPMMIPYKGNEYLLGKTDDCNEYYKIWEL